MRNQIIVIKVGTSTLITKNEAGIENLDQESFARIGKQIIELIEAGYKVVLVSSAAITAGLVATNTFSRPDRETNMVALQRLASIGWRNIINAWDEATPNITVGELLLTSHSLSLAHERDVALKLIHELLINGDIPVINENDAITYAEIAFGDNDTLAATVAAKIAGSDLFDYPVKFIMLSDVDGVYADAENPASLISEINDIDQHENVVKNSSTKYGTGGMTTKFMAAKIATKADVPTIVANGRRENVIQDSLNRVTGTIFNP